jgi:hypothetical protein
MKQSDYSLNLNNIQRLMKKHKEKGMELFVDVVFITDKKPNKIINKGTHSDICLINEHLNCSKPDSIRFEFFDSKEATLCRFPRLFPLVEKLTKQQPVTMLTEFKGFGEAEINSLVDQRLFERQQKEDFEELQIQVKDLSDEVNEQSALIEELETENEQLKTELEEKKQVRYYAGMLGDILEGIGISKDKIRNPIASLMGISDAEKPKEIHDSTHTAQSTQAQHDSSGIVEDEEPLTKEQEERKVIITLITHYLDAADNKTLAQVFTVFSAIEHNSEKAGEIITYLKSQNA